MRLLFPLRAGLAAAMLLLVSGCFEVELDLQIKPNGKTTATQMMKMSEGFASAAREMAKITGDTDPVAQMQEDLDDFSDEDAALFKANKVKLKERVVDLSAPAPLIKVSVQTRTLAGLDYLNLAAGDTEPTKKRRVKITRNDDGTATLVMSASDVGTAGKDEEEAEPEKEKPELTPEQVERVGELTMGLMSEMSNLRIVNRIQVPGEIVSATPELGQEIDGDTVVWTFGANNAMEMGGATDASGFTVVFKPASNVKDTLYE